MVAQDEGSSPILIPPRPDVEIKFDFSNSTFCAKSGRMLEKPSLLVISEVFATRDRAALWRTTKRLALRKLPMSCYCGVNVR